MKAPYFKILVSKYQKVSILKNTKIFFQFGWHLASSSDLESFLRSTRGSGAKKAPIEEEIRSLAAFHKAGVMNISPCRIACRTHRACSFHLRHSGTHE